LAAPDPHSYFLPYEWQNSTADVTPAGRRRASIDWEGHPHIAEPPGYASILASGDAFLIGLHSGWASHVFNIGYVRVLCLDTCSHDLPDTVAFPLVAERIRYNTL
jgi:hypothetical protein